MRYYLVDTHHNKYPFPQGLNDFLEQISAFGECSVPLQMSEILEIDFGWAINHDYFRDDVYDDAPFWQKTMDLHRILSETLHKVAAFDWEGQIIYNERFEEDRLKLGQDYQTDDNGQFHSLLENMISFNPYPPKSNYLVSGQLESDLIQMLDLLDRLGVSEGSMVKVFYD